MILFLPVSFKFKIFIFARVFSVFILKYVIVNFYSEYVYVIWMWIDWYRKYQPAEPEYEVCWRVSKANESQNSYSVEQAERHNLPYDVNNYDVSAEVIKNCVKYIFVGRCLLIFLTRQFLIWYMFKKNNVN